MEARITAQSQSFKLRERLEEAKVSHGQEVRADLPRIAVTAMAGGTAGEVFFCKLGAIRVREVRNPGNDRRASTSHARWLPSARPQKPLRHSVRVPAGKQR